MSIKKALLTLTILSTCLAGCSLNQTSKQENTALEIQSIPENYKSPATHSGELVQLDYTTYESLSYESHDKTLQKSAYVYLPYQYDPHQSYNIFYLMHGGWSNETTVLGTSSQPTELKYAIDHAIEDGLMDPLIIVCPTYNNENPDDSDNYSLALTLTDNYHNELVNDLIPAVEGKYSTYAKDTTPEGLRQSRDHRGFGGFSMGSVATWHTFEYCLDYFRYFMPMSGSLTSDGDYMTSIVENAGYSWNDFFIFAFSGTDDFAYQSFTSQIEAMKNADNNIFRFANDETKGNLNYLIKEGASHDAKASHEYTYNCLLWFWNH